MEWFDFFITAISAIVTTLFSLNVFSGVSLGDVLLALMVVGVASALVLRIKK